MKKMMRWFRRQQKYLLVGLISLLMAAFLIAKDDDGAFLCFITH